MKVRIYCQTDENGWLKNIVFGEGVSVLDDFPFFFVLDKERAEYIADNMPLFKMEIINFKTELVEQPLLNL